eukprot:g7948.t1
MCLFMIVVVVIHVPYFSHSLFINESTTVCPSCCLSISAGSRCCAAGACSKSSDGVMSGRGAARTAGSTRRPRPADRVRSAPDQKPAGFVGREALQTPQTLVIDDPEQCRDLDDSESDITDNEPATPPEPDSPRGPPLDTEEAESLEPPIARNESIMKNASVDNSQAPRRHTFPDPSLSLFRDDAALKAMMSETPNKPTEDSITRNFSSAALDKHTAMEPRILLEVLNPTWLRLLLVLNYIVLLACLLFSFYEKEITYSSTYFPVDLCDGDKEQSGECSAVWSFEQIYLPIELFFSVEAGLTWNQDIMLNKPFDVNATVTLMGTPQNHEDDTDSKLQIILYNKTISSRIQCSGEVPKYKVDALPVCTRFTLLKAEDYRASYEFQSHEIHDFLFIVSWPQGANGANPLPMLADITYSVTVPNPNFRYTLIALHIGLCGFTAFFILYFAFKVFWQGWERVLPEHLWILGALVALGLFQNPVYTWLQMEQSYVWNNLTVWFFSLATVALLLFWIAMMDAARGTEASSGGGLLSASTRSYEGLNQSLLPNLPEETSEEHVEVKGGLMDESFIKVGRYGQFLSFHMGYNCRFYGPKLLLGLVLCLSCVGLLLVFGRPNVTVSANGEVTSTFGPDTFRESPFVIACASGIAVSCTCLIIWLLTSLWLSVGYLRNLPYVATRYRQLSFRFFLLQTWLIIMYFLPGLFEPLWTPSMMNYVQQEFVLTRSRSLSTLALLSIYVYLFAFVYLPAPTVKDLETVQSACCVWMPSWLKQHERPQFSIKVARLLWPFAWQAYFVPHIQGPPATPSKKQKKVPEDADFVMVNVPTFSNIGVLAEGYIDLRPSGFMSILDVHMPEADTRAFVAERFPDVQISRRTSIQGDMIDKDPASVPEVVVAFRGSASMDHLALAMRTKLVPWQKLPAKGMDRLCRAARLESWEAGGLGQESKNQRARSFWMGRLRGDRRKTMSGHEESALPHIASEIAGLLQLNVGRVHQGFWDSYCPMRVDILETIVELLKDFQEQGFWKCRIYCTGHSLGGVYATFAAFDLAKLLSKLFPEHSGYEIYMYNFGAPRLGDATFCRSYDEAVPRSFRLVFDRDIVTTFPKFSWRFKHSGQEIWMDANGNLVVDPPWIDKMMLESRQSIADHQLVAYRKALDILAEVFYT